MSTNLFEYATRNKLRFTTIRGEMSVEQLWDVPLRSKDDFNLDVVAKTVNKTLKSLAEESFVETRRTPAHARTEVMLEVVRHIIEVKLEEETTAERRAENKKKKEQLLKVLAEKQEGQLSALSVKELQKQIAALEE